MLWIFCLLEAATIKAVVLHDGGFCFLILLLLCYSVLYYKKKSKKSSGCYIHQAANAPLQYTQKTDVMYSISGDRKVDRCSLSPKHFA